VAAIRISMTGLILTFLPSSRQLSVALC